MKFVGQSNPDIVEENPCLFGRSGRLLWVSQNDVTQEHLICSLTEVFLDIRTGHGSICTGYGPEKYLREYSLLPLNGQRPLLRMMFYLEGADSGLAIVSANVAVLARQRISEDKPLIVPGADIPIRWLNLTILWEGCSSAENITG